MSVRALEPGPVGIILGAADAERRDGGAALTVVAGRTLLERAVLTLRAAGIEDVVVVLGDESKAVQDFLHRNEPSVRVALNDGTSSREWLPALVGASAADRRFLLVSADRVFEPEVIGRLLAADAPFVLGVDTSARPSDDAKTTKVTLEGRRVMSLSPDLTVWDAIDAGVALCGAPAADTATRSVASGEAVWNTIRHRWLARGGTIEAVDLAGLVAVQAHTATARRCAERAIVRRAARQPFDGPVFRHLNRRMSWRISLLFVRLSVPAAAATAAAFVLALAAACVLALGAVSPLALVAGGVLVQVAAVADGVNGEVARASLRSTRAGAFFDPVLDRIADAALLVALAVAAGLGPATSIALAVALFGTLFGTCVNALYEAVYRRPPPRPLLPMSLGHDVRLLAIAVFAIVLQPFWGLVAVAVIASVESGQRLVAVAIESRVDGRAVRSGVAR